LSGCRNAHVHDTLPFFGSCKKRPPVGAENAIRHRKEGCVLVKEEKRCEDNKAQTSKRHTSRKKVLRSSKNHGLALRMQIYTTRGKVVFWSKKSEEKR